MSTVAMALFCHRLYLYNTGVLSLSYESSHVSIGEIVVVFTETEKQCIEAKTKTNKNIKSM